MLPGRWIFPVIVTLCCAAGAGTAAHPAAAGARALVDRAVNGQRAGANEQAVTLLSQAVASRALSRPDLVRALFDRGVAFDAMGKTRAAIADYSAALRLDPRFAPALNNRANAYRRTGRRSDAMHDYAAALKCANAPREYTYFGLGRIAEERGDEASARDYYHQALIANPGFALAAQSLVRLDYRDQAALMQASAQERASEFPATPIVPAASLPAAAAESGKRTRGMQIQLGAYRDEAAASAGWTTISEHSAGALDGLAPVIEAADIPGKGRFYRLRADVSDRESARRVCDALAAQSQPCFVTRE